MKSAIVNKAKDVLGRYKNGNYYVEIWSDGTKIRIQPNDDEDFVPSFAENCDVKITDKCDGLCPFCYEGCTPEGEHGELLNLPLWDTLHPYTELAINGNDLSHPQLDEFLEKMKEKKIIVNMTVNQRHLEENLIRIHEWQMNGYIHGLGISLQNPTHKFLDRVTFLHKNAVIHTILGVTTPEEYMTMYDEDVRVLILGYKYRGRGKKYMESQFDEIKRNSLWVKKNLKAMVEHFKVLSFDNLAIEQLDLKNLGILTEDEWNEFYMGDDGNYTFYIDLVKKEFAKNSVSEQRYSLLDNIDDMFNKVRNNA